MPEARGPRGGRRPGEARTGGRDPRALRGIRRLEEPGSGGLLRLGAPPRPGGFWDGVLEPGERILWSGRPRPGLLPGREDAPQVALGGALAGLAGGCLVWPIRAGMAVNHGSGLLLVLAGLALAALGAALLAGAVRRARGRLARLSYLLTNRRAVVITLGPEPDLALYPLTPRTRLRLKPGRPGSVFFARDLRPSRPPGPGGAGRPGRPVPYDVGFERIDDAEAVYRLMRALIGAAPEPVPGLPPGAPPLGPRGRPA